MRWKSCCAHACPKRLGAHTVMESTALQTYCYHYLWLRQGGYAKSVDSYGGYASEMNPKLKGKKVPQLPKEPVEEYIPPPFNANAPQVRSGSSNPSACLQTSLPDGWIDSCRFLASFS